MIIDLVHQVIMWLNAFLLVAGVSKEINPRVLLTGVPIEFKKHYQCPFGVYVHVHDVVNSTENPHTLGDICIGPTGNLQRSYTLINLATGYLIYRTKCTEILKPEHVITCVDALAVKDKTTANLIFKDINQVPWPFLEGIDDNWTDSAAYKGLYGDSRDDNE